MSSSASSDHSSAFHSLRGQTTAAIGSLDLPSSAGRFRSNSCIGLPHGAEAGAQREGCIGGIQLNASNSALDRLNNQNLNNNNDNGHGHQLATGPAKDPVVESSLAIRKLSQAFGEFCNKNAEIQKKRKRQKKYNSVNWG
jgi:hypothetical protein